MSRNYWELIIICVFVSIGIAYCVINYYVAFPVSNGVNGNILVHNYTTDTYNGYGMSFNFPSDWSVNVVKGDGTNIIISPNKYDPDDPLCQVSSQSLGMSNQETINTVLTSPGPPGSTLISNTTLKINNNTVYESTFSLNDPADDILHINSIVKNGTMYSVLIQAPATQFNQLKPKFDIILNSFKIQ